MATPVIAAAVVAALVWVVISQVAGVDRRAAYVLEHVARVAGSRSVDRFPAPGEYLYVRTMVTERVTGVSNGEAWSALLPTIEERWIASDGSGRISRASTEPRFLSPTDRLRWEAAGSPRVGPIPSSRTLGPGRLTNASLTKLQTSPTKLFEAIETRARRSDAPLNVEMFVIVGDLLREPLAPASLRAALYSVAARIPSLEFIGRVKDSLGRPGIAVAVTTDYSGALERRLLIFDPRTSAVLAEERVLLESVEWLNAEPPVTVYERVEVTRATVRSIRTRPR